MPFVGPCVWRKEWQWLQSHCLKDNLLSSIPIFTNSSIKPIQTKPIRINMSNPNFTRKRIRGKFTRIGIKPPSMPSKKEVVNKFKPK
jgi:hypothetical protein